VQTRKDLADEVRSGGSYLSQNDFRLHFGLAKARNIERLEIEWPDGCRQSRSNLPANQLWTIKEEHQRNGKAMSKPGP
ncbi:MAG: ASPIC/UnbV domain-containing protein, partial [Pyrinomonadaceae bacterium]